MGQKRRHWLGHCLWRILCSYNVPPCPIEMESEQYDYDVRKPLRMRVCNVLYGRALRSVVWVRSVGAG